MKSSRLALPLVAAIGCALTGRYAGRAPLESEGEVLVVLQPLAIGDLHGVPLEPISIAAVHADAEVPLQLLVQRVEPGNVRAQRLLARGRLAPGSYSGLSIQIRPPPPPEGRPSVAAPVPPPPIRVEVPFAVSAQKSAVIALRARFEVRDGGEGEPQPPVAVLSAMLAPRTLPPAAGFCSDLSDHEVMLFDEDARVVAAVLPTGRSPWGLAVDAVANRLYVALADEDRIAMFDTGSGEQLSTMRLSLGDQPRELALAPDRRTLVSANSGTNSVSLIDAGSMVELARVAVGIEPTSLLMDRRGQRVYVFNRASGSFSVVDLPSRTLVVTVATDDQPLRGQLDRSGSKLYVAHARSPFLAVYSLSDYSVLKRVYVGLGTSAIKVDARSDLIYVAKSGEERVAVYDPFSLIAIGSVETAPGVSYMAIDDAQNALFALSAEARSVSVVDLASRKTISAFDVGDDARVLALTTERN